MGKLCGFCLSIAYIERPYHPYIESLPTSAPILHRKSTDSLILKCTMSFGVKCATALQPFELCIIWVQRCDRVYQILSNFSVLQATGNLVRIWEQAKLALYCQLWASFSNGLDPEVSLALCYVWFNGTMIVQFPREKETVLSLSSLILWFPHFVVPSFCGSTLIRNMKWVDNWPQRCSAGCSQLKLRLEAACSYRIYYQLWGKRSPLSR